MSLQAGEARADERAGVPLAAFAALAVATTVGALVVYKASSAIGAIGNVQAGGTVGPKAEWIATSGLPAAAIPLVGALNYLAWVLVALLFGLLIGSLVRALIPSRWLAAALGGGGATSHLVAALIGAPLMLCSCCVAPVFEGIYARTRKLGPALGVMLAAPGLNPADVALTFMLFPPRIAWARLLGAVALVLFGGAALGRAFDAPQTPLDCPLDAPKNGWRELLRAVGTSLREVSRQSLPAILLGVLASAALVGLVPIEALASTTGGALVTTLLVGVAATLIALPTFGEIPIGLALLSAGAPEPAVLALLLAGPIVNLPSLLNVARVGSWRLAAATGGAVLVVSWGAGALLA